MKINIEICEDELKDLIINHLENKLNTTIDKTQLKIVVKSKQNYRSEWEVAAFKATYESLTD